MVGLSSVPLFDELADRYDQVVPMFSTFAIELVELLAPGPGTRFLDVGSGRGAVALAVAARGAHVVATDASERMVAALARDNPGLDARVMDAHELDLAADSFDTAAASFVIHCVDDPERVVAEMCRVVRPGGLVALTVPGPVEHDDGQWDRYREIGTRFAPRPDAELVARPVDVAALLASALLVDIRQTSIEVDLPVPSPQLLWDFEMSHGFAGYVRSFTVEDQREFRRQARRELQRMHGDGGIRLRRGAAVHTGRLPTGTHGRPSEPFGP